MEPSSGALKSGSLKCGDGAKGEVEKLFGQFPRSSFCMFGWLNSLATNTTMPTMSRAS